MRLFLGIVFCVFGAVHLWAAFMGEKVADPDKPSKYILGISLNRTIHFLAGLMLFLFGLLFCLA